MWSQQHSDENEAVWNSSPWPDMAAEWARAAAIRSGLVCRGRSPWLARAVLIFSTIRCARVVVAPAGAAPIRAVELTRVTASRDIRAARTERFSTRGPSAGNRSTPVRPRSFPQPGRINPQSPAGVQVGRACLAQSGAELDP